MSEQKGLHVLEFLDQLHEVHDIKVLVEFVNALVQEVVLLGDATEGSLAQTAPQFEEVRAYPVS